ncbi:hypothetical protein HanRHA438_Chr09g0428161 [Helianthus annuus]|nr:hypothetical protein HanRHA438_Chr09g0428161 [Helianthus annuus]
MPLIFGQLELDVTIVFFFERQGITIFWVRDTPHPPALGRPVTPLRPDVSVLTVPQLASESDRRPKEKPHRCHATSNRA